MTPDDIHDQVDNADRDWTVSGDAMRWAPPKPPVPPVPVVPFTGRAAAHAMLVLRLVDNHGLTPPAAEAAVRAAHTGEPTEHSELVAAEARAAAAEMGQQLTQTVVHLFQAMQPALQAAAAAARKFAEALQQASKDDYELAPPPIRPKDRPAWQSPYGPPPTRRR
ncbi:hypothetical protein [Streptomyces sp. NRRL S-146]|uniref:hypothetical protein n=1 Tax=Streptomyces sp. NRRL S-146 TaxID=1463884 RepID=UPI0004C5D86B|nr:hypothetical protein [Streptomyces sp. NRRL S-146]